MSDYSADPVRTERDWGNAPTELVVGFFAGVLVNLPGVCVALFVEDRDGGPSPTYLALAITAGAFLTGMALIGSYRWRWLGAGVAVGTAFVVLSVVGFLFWWISTVLGG